MTHTLKIEPQYFNQVISGAKTFEIRKNDRDYHIGDRLLLKEWDGRLFTGRATQRTVTYITDYMQKKDYVVMGMIF